MSTTKTKKGGEASPSPPTGANNRGNDINSAIQRYRYIPLDYIRGRIKGIDPGTFIEKLCDLHPGIEVDTTFTGEGLRRETFVYQNMVFNRYEGRRVYLSGSIHKFSNQGEHNANQFSETAFDQAIARLENELLVRPENIEITRLEYGVNIAPPLPCDQILNRCYQHKGVDVVQMKTKGEGKYHCADHSRFILKLYDKGKQYHLSDETLRIEVKVTKWEQYRQQGIVSLADFINAGKTPFVCDLINRWGEVVFADPTTQYPDKWHKFTNREYWRELRTGCRQKFNRRFAKLKHLNETQGANIQGQISDLICTNINALHNSTPQKSVTFGSFMENRVCRLTGVPIYHQRKNSFLLSHAGLKYLIAHELETYTQIKKGYLTKKWQNAPLQVQVREIAHNIRNHYFNRRRPSPGARNPAQTKLPFFG